MYLEALTGRPSRQSHPAGEGKAADPLVAADLTPEAEEARRAVTHAFIGPIGRRAVAVFLGRSDYRKVHHLYSDTMANLLMACLPDLVHELGGQVILTALFANSDHLNAITFPLEVDGRTQQVVTDGHVFIHLPEERVVVSADSEDTPRGLVSHVVVRSNRDSAAFFKRWVEYGREHNHLRGRAFFADGDLIERDRRYTWDDILLPEKVKRAVQTHVQGFLANRDRLRALGVKARRGLILEGRPGTGKTLLGKVLADTLGVSFLWVTPRHVESPRSFDYILRLARFVAPTVVFLEDLDLFAEDRRGKGWMGLGELMNQLDGAVENQDVITIATTNRLEVVEDALRNRPGRFDRVLTIDALDEPCRRWLIEKLLAKAKVASEDMSYLVSSTEDYTGAQLEELANTLYILAIQQDAGDPSDADGNDGGSKDDGCDGVSAPPPLVITRPLIDEALEEVQTEPGRTFGFRVA